MLPFLKLFVGLVFISGIGAAIGVPLSMNSVKNDITANDNSARGGGDKQVSINSSAINITNMSRCDTQSKRSLSEINYGSANVKDVCWTVQASSSDVSTVRSSVEKYSELFKKMWGSKQSSWAKATNDWQSVNCNLGSKWLFASIVGGKDYLGLCDGSEYSNQKWITVEDKNRLTPKIEVCTGSCFESEDQPYGTKRLNPNTKTGNWSSVKFFKKKS